MEYEEYLDKSWKISNKRYKLEKKHTWYVENDPDNPERDVIHRKMVDYTDEDHKLTGIYNRSKK